MADLGTIDSATLNETSYTNVTFTNQTNQYAMEIGDKIGIAYLGAGQDEGSGSLEDYLLWAAWEWVGNEVGSELSNEQYDIPGNSEYIWRASDNHWHLLEGGKSELVYRAEKYGSSTNPCDPDPGPGPGPPEPPGPGPPPPPGPGGYIVISDFNDVNATTAYQVGNGPPNNITRRAVSVDNRYCGYPECSYCKDDLLDEKSR